MNKVSFRDAATWLRSSSTPEQVRMVWKLGMEHRSPAIVDLAIGHGANVNQPYGFVSSEHPILTIMTEAVFIKKPTLGGQEAFRRNRHERAKIRKIVRMMLAQGVNLDQKKYHGGPTVMDYILSRAYDKALVAEVLIHHLHDRLERGAMPYAIDFPAIFQGYGDGQDGQTRIKVMEHIKDVHATVRKRLLNPVSDIEIGRAHV